MRITSCALDKDGWKCFARFYTFKISTLVWKSKDVVDLCTLLSGNHVRGDVQAFAVVDAVWLLDTIGVYFNLVLTSNFKYNHIRSVLDALNFIF